VDLAKLRLYVERRKQAMRLGLDLPLTKLGTTSEYVALLPERLTLNGRRVRVSLPDEQCIRGTFLEVVLEDVYGLKRAELPVRAVLDVGANVGIFCLAARDAFPDARIHAYEPNADLERYLKVQAEATGATCFMEAVALADGFVDLCLADVSVATKTVMSDTGRIRAVSLRTAMERIGGTADFVKLDCEGAEWDLLSDPGPWRRVRNLSLEYHLDGMPDHTPEKAESLVTALGFGVVRKGGPAYGVGWINAHRL
jgi:FkbM family methyltransferase